MQNQTMLNYKRLSAFLGLLVLALLIVILVLIAAIHGLSYRPQDRGDKEKELNTTFDENGENKTANCKYPDTILINRTSNCTSVDGNFINETKNCRCVNDAITIETIKCTYPNEDFIDLSEPETPSVFHDLTTTEIRAINAFLRSQDDLDLDLPPVSSMESNYRYLAELYLPEKAKVLQHLDHGRPQPAREAKVTLIMGKQVPPVVKEYVVGPLPVPSYKKRVPGKPENIPFIFRPIGSFELSTADSFLKQRINDELGDVIELHYKAKLVDCESRNKCLGFDYFSQMSPSVSGERTRKLWFWLSRLSEYYLLNMLDFAVLLNTETKDFFIEKIWFQGETFNSLEEVKNKFLNDLKPYDALTDEEQLFSSPRTRNGPQPEPYGNLRAPYQVLPDGVRYRIKHRHVEYFGWSFYFRSSSAYGPQVYDIRFRNERIVYELGLQEMSVFYSAHNPAQMFADFFDSSDLIGPKTTWLVPGVDCPVHSTFVKTVHSLEASDEPQEFEHAFCVFEWNTGDPLRRHLSTYPYQRAFFEGMESVALVLRTSITVMNYDYIVDFRFFANGVIQTRVLFTGFISTSFYSPEEDEYGFKLHKNIFGPLHVHLINFKVDIDIKGTKNRFESLDIEEDDVDNIWSNDHDLDYHLTKFKRHLVETEKEAAYKYDFDHPKYLLVSSNSSGTTTGTGSSYRITINGMVKQLLKRGSGNEPAASWARYQMAITKHKDDEQASSCQYSAFDSTEPYLRFQDYIDDDDEIVDEDLVMWVTLGTHHIPKTEDLPVVTTAGMETSFSLSPFNYFPEDPALRSQESLRIEPRDGLDPGKGIKFNTEETHSTCRRNSIQEILESPEIIFDTSS